MHNLSTSFVLGYHGCDRAIGEKLLQNEKFKPSENDYDWLGHGIYFWESNPKRALDWANQRAEQLKKKNIAFDPFVVGAVIDLGFCLDLMSSNGTEAVEQAYKEFEDIYKQFNFELPINIGTRDYFKRHLDCAVIEYLHVARSAKRKQRFDTVLQ